MFNTLSVNDAREAQNAAYSSTPPANAGRADCDPSIGPIYGHMQDDTLRCEPAQEQRKHIFHWLVYLATARDGKETLSAACDLWRWHEGEWRSVFVAGAAFTPEEMFAQGWRYCAPNVQAIVKIAAKPGKRYGKSADVGQPLKQPAMSNRPMAPGKRNRALALAVPGSWPEAQRAAPPLRRKAGHQI